ncbi:MAG TPA: hypothetical protein VLL54_08315 [Pyrinomonadaceae bacterium]|nr:hypothetical protein [Pyrinomonadaceae bacterium]
MRRFLVIAVILTVGVISASAQTSNNRKHHAEKATSEKESAFPATSFSYPLDDYKPGVVQVGPRTTYLKEGLRTDEVVRLLGRPSASSERKENEVVVKVYEFQRGEHQVLVAEFVSDLLVRYRTEARDEQTVRADQ